MTDRIKITAKHITVYGKRVSVSYVRGPWVEGIDPAMIKIRPKVGHDLSALIPFFVVENNSDSREDYFEADSVRVLPTHPLYAQIAAVA